MLVLARAGRCTAHPSEATWSIRIEDPQEGLVGQLGIGDRDLAPQREQRGIAADAASSFSSVERVDAADEELLRRIRRPATARRRRLLNARA
ncbi:MAG: hypothetical protein R3E12_11085 [Candidatus Eisenbacteria bacterium]